MICLRGKPEELSYLSEIAKLGAGIEFGSYGIIGIQSEEDWDACYTKHKAIRAQFRGPLAIHGPFIGMEYAHMDHLIRDVVNHRLDMTFNVAVDLNVRRVILHNNYTPTLELFKLRDRWYKRCVAFWQQEIHRWADAGIEIVLENVTERTPDILLQLVNEVDSPWLGICLDTGHQHLFSKLDAFEWVQKIGARLFHIHLHDNDRTSDEHWSIGRGTIDFESLYTAIQQHAPQVTISLEVEDTMEVKMADLRKLADRFALSHDIHV
jgi:sugar phosphate isomerase/epimerase